MLCYIRPLGGGLAYIHPFSGPVDPGFGMPGGAVDPDYGIGTHPRPGHDLPHIPGIPDNSLPSGPPPHVPQGTVLVMVRDPAGVWHWATLAPESPPPVVVEPPMAPTPAPKA